MEINNKSFSCNTSFWTDTPEFDGAFSFQIDADSSTLILNSAKFQAGDTVFGKLYAKTKKIKYFENRPAISAGTFRCIVKERKNKGH
jgi:hypothetical protein